jgi:lycopene beta-cyclase
VGGGLANCLVAWRLQQLRPEVAVTVLEAGPELAGNHTWCFHPTDLTPAQNRWLAPLVQHAWSRQEVRFPGRRRVLETGYRAITAEGLRAAFVDGGPTTVRTGSPVAELRPDGVTLASGEELAADGVIDGRGHRPSAHQTLAYQKFLGQEWRTTDPHGLAHPLLMDATVSQEDGYRFVYVLPLAADRLLIEDTRYSDGPELDDDALAAAIGDYAKRQGWGLAERLREEHGVLPILLAGEPEAFWAEGPAGVARSGLAAGLFHPTTGYSLPDAVRLADAIAGADRLDGDHLHRLTRAYSRAHWRRTGFFRLLNRMLFGAAAPAERYRVLERFYGLPRPLIERFYAGQSTWADRARLLAGRPPVPLSAALGCLSARAFQPRRGSPHER